ncbi:MAG: haloacid dehalogenase-like hydrolase, partial [archaeon]
MVKERIVISNPKKFEEKKSALIRGGAKSLHIIADFDRTLTKEFNGKNRINTVIAQLREGNYLAPGYAAKSYALHGKYYPIEKDSKLPYEEKKEKMQEWWGTHIKMIAESGMNRKVMLDIIKKKKITLRNGALKFFDELNSKKVPTLILSAALGDFIEEILKSEGRLYKNIHVISNFFEFDRKGNVKGYKGKIVHALNKSEAEIEKTPYMKKVLKRKNIILLGDSTDDLDMIKGIDYENALKIGFLNGEVEKNLKDYKKAFDVIICNDASMDFV